MGCQRPAWTVCFALIWVVVAIGTIVMHVALGGLVPAIQALPGNLGKGFNEVFGFDHLVTEAGNIKTASTAAIDRCVTGMTAATYCGLQGDDPCSAGANTANTDATAEKEAILAAFDRGLSKIMTVGKDKYFGMDSFKDAADKLDEITQELDQLDVKGPCCATSALFCGMLSNADMLSDMGESVSEMIDGLIQNDAVETFEAQSSNLTGLHALPWILIISSTLFAILWWKNGACCCCSNGTCLQVVLLVLPQMLLWLVAFIIMLIFTVIGWGVTFVLLPMELTMFNGSPTLGDLLDHIQTAFSEFWKIVLQDLVDSLDTFRTASTIMTVACLFVVGYAGLFCCCRPYGTGAGSCEHGVPDNVYCKQCEEPSQA